ncbi:MAG: radical SAM family heme chaperone HemW [Pyrinomonadaceae bacterium]
MQRIGIYIHIPFCRTRCSYCDFATRPFESEFAARYVRALALEIENFVLPFAAREVDTIYFGGGTPSLLSAAQVETILEAVRRRFHVATNAEVTMEIDPGTATPDVLHEFRRLGITRASFGVQTFDDDELRRLGRAHTAEDARRTLKDLRAAGFDNVSFDLIAGLPGQTIETWQRNVKEALALRPEHLSLYLLEVHEGTPLAAQIERGKVVEPNDDAAALMYQLLAGEACAAGYERYEISNFCLPGYDARHNTKYWTTAPVYGFGCAAHSFDGVARRWSNERNAARYITLVEEKHDAVVENTELNEREQRAESVFLGLRLTRGLDLRAHRARYGVDLTKDYATDVARLADAGLIELTNDTMKLTNRGALLSNEVFAVFV